AEVRQFVLGEGHLTAVRGLARTLREERPEVAFAAIGASNAKLLAAKALAGWRGAAVLSVHGRFDAESRPLGQANYLATALTSRLSTRTIAVSDDLRGYLIDRFHATPERVVTIHNGVMLPAAEMLPTAAALAARQNIVLGIGRLVPEKDFASLVE